MDFTETKKHMWCPFLLSVILFSKALIFLGIIQFSGIGLGPDEAQYWTWAQFLDWGYYSKPPGIAWQIWLGTKLFGQTEWGVRSLSVFLSIFQSFMVYRLALSAGLRLYTAFWCGLFMAFTPLGMASSFFAITDVGFLLCWIGACHAIVSALKQNEEANPFKIGAWIIGGSLFKWPIYLFWILAYFSRIWYFPNQKKGKFLSGILFSLLGFLPSLWWNATHHWVTFRHVFATIQGGSGERASGNILEFIGSQALLLFPIFFILFILSFWHWLRKRKKLSPALFFCGFVTLASLIPFIILALFQKIQGNWVIFAYPTGFIILGWYLLEQRPPLFIWAKIGLGCSILAISLFFIFPSISSSPMFSAYVPPFRSNPFKHNLGWSQLPGIFAKHGYDPNHHFLLSDKYQTTSILSFYSPHQKRAYFLNIHGVRNNQFSYWPSLQQEQQGKTGFFLWIENGERLTRDWQNKKEFYQNVLKQYFERVEFLELAPLRNQGSAVVKAALIFRCESCKEIVIPGVDLY